MRFVLAMVVAGLVALPLSVSARAGEEGTSAKPSAEEPAPSTEQAPEEPALAVPDIDTLSQRAVERFEIQYEIQSEEKNKRERRRRRALGIGVPIAVAVVVVMVVGVAVGVSWGNEPSN